MPPRMTPGQHPGPASFFLPEDASVLELYAFIQGFLARGADNSGWFGDGPRAVLEVTEENGGDHRFLVRQVDSYDGKEVVLRTCQIGRGKARKVYGKKGIGRCTRKCAWCISAQLRAAGISSYTRAQADA